jgi:hypothetical protein
MLKENRTLRSLAISLCAILPAGSRCFVSVTRLGAQVMIRFEPSLLATCTSACCRYVMRNNYAKNICPGLKLNKKGLEDIVYLLLLVLNQKDFTSSEGGGISCRRP